MITKIPEVTVLMPAYNAGKYISEAVESILCQTFTDFELLIINDGSTDNTMDVLNRFSDSRIKILTQKNAGVAAALNSGLQHSLGKLVCRFDADDISHPQRLEKQTAFLLDNPDYVITGSDAEYILENGQHLFNFLCLGHSHTEITDKLLFYCPFIHSSVTYRKDVVMEAGGYSPYAHNFEDYLLWIQIVKKGKFYNIPEQLVKVRFNAASVTIDEKWRGKRFRELKKTIILRGNITKEEGNEILSILKKQDIRKIKEASYHSLCAKKFLVDNYRPVLAREHLQRAIAISPARIDNYAILLISFLPKRLVKWIRSKRQNKL